MLKYGQGTKWRRKIAENFNRLSRVHERYRRQTDDGRATAYSEREHEFTFANKTDWIRLSKYVKTHAWTDRTKNCRFVA